MALDIADNLATRLAVPALTERRPQLEELGRDAILFAARVGLAVLMLWHVKVAWDYTGGVGGMVRGFDALGIPFPEAAARFNLALEFFGGLALILGLGTRTVGLLMAVNMAGAWHYVHTSGLYAMDGNGPELVIAIALVSLMLAATGPGRVSVSRILGARAR